MYNINYSSTDAQAYENIDCFLSSNLYNFELRTAIIAKKIHPLLSGRDRSQ
jgi:hypothetical protein